jgi:transposase-like protein
MIGRCVVMVDQRPQRALAIYAKGNQIKRLDGSTYKVKSQSNGGFYLVVRNGEDWSCECPDHKFRQVTCKHIHSVLFSLTLRNSITTSQDIIPRADEADPEDCVYCHSSEIVKRGTRKNKRGLTQVWWCKACKKRFVVDLGFSKMKCSPQVITASLDLYFKGISLRKITDHLKQFHGVTVNCSTVLRWIQRYIALMKEYADKLMPDVSGTWHADETTINVNGQYQWLWNLMDRDTRFLISSRLTQTRREHEATKLFLEAQRATGITPNTIVTDGLLSYQAAYDRTFAKNHTTHIRSPRFIDKTNNNIVERLHSTLKTRTKVMRALDGTKSSDSIIDGLKIDYNFIRPHSSLSGLTPAEAAGLPSLGKNKWKTLIQQSAEANGRKETPTQKWRRKVIEGTIRRYLEGEANGVSAKWVLKQIEYLKNNGMTEAELRAILSKFNNPTLLAFLR